MVQEEVKLKQEQDISETDFTPSTSSESDGSTEESDNDIREEVRDLLMKKGLYTKAKALSNLALLSL